MGDAPSLEICVMGPLEVRVGGRTEPVRGANARVLLAHLARLAPHWTTTERVADLIWRDDAPPGARKAVQMHVVRVRQAFGQAAIESGLPGSYRLGRDVTRDVDRFLDLAREASAALAAQQCGRAAGLARAGLGLWRGDPWADLDDDHDVLAERTALEIRHRQLELVLAESLICSDPGRAQVMLTRLAAYTSDPDRHDRLLAHAARLAGSR